MSETGRPTDKGSAVPGVVPGSPAAHVQQSVEAIFSENADVDLTVTGYLILNRALSRVADLQGPGAAAQLAYRLGDQFAGKMV